MKKRIMLAILLAVFTTQVTAFSWPAWFRFIPNPVIYNDGD